MNIFLIGATGFVGKSLKEYFKKQGHFVVSPPRSVNWANFQSFLTYWNVDLKGWNFHFDAVIQCAGRGGRKGAQDDMTIISENLIINENAYQAFKILRGEKFFFIGSGAEQDREEGVTNIGSPSKMPKDNYGISKRLIWERYSGIPNVFNLRAFGLFGKHEEEQRFIKSALTAYRENKEIVIHKEKKMDFFFIDDVGQIIETIVKHDYLNPSNDINLSYPTRNLYLSAVAGHILQLSSRKVPVVIEDYSLDKDYYGSSKKLEELIELSHKKGDKLDLIGLQEGLRRTL